MNGDTPTIPGEASQALLIVQRCLGDSLLAVYLHGSAVAGGLRPGSDVDLLVVTNQPTTPKVRECLVAELRKISGRHPAGPSGPRPLELIVFQHADLMASVYPVRSESFTASGCGRHSRLVWCRRRRRILNSPSSWRKQGWRRRS
jgi:hypothetical protein